MSEELEIFKKKILYRASYRGTKEMDILLTGFVKKYINSFDNKQLKELETFLQFDDDVIYDFYYNEKINQDIKNNSISGFFKKFKP